MIRRARAIVLRRTPFGNTSLVVSFAAEGLGLVRTLAKGARRAPKKRFARPPEIFARGEILFYPRRGDGLSILAEWSEEEARRGIFAAADAGVALLRLAAAHAATEIASMSTHSGDEERELFLSLDRALERIARAPGREEAAMALLAFEMETLAILGAMPDLSCCSSCARDLVGPGRPGQTAWLRPSTGGPSERRSGLLCRDCLSADGGAGETAAELTADALALARLLSRPGEFPYSRVRARPAALLALSRALLAAITAFLERRLRSTRRLRAVGLV